jgi:hypothetical protein
MEKHELSKIDFEIIENAFNALLQSRPDPMTADKIEDLRERLHRLVGNRTGCVTVVSVKNPNAPAVKRSREKKA